MPSSSSNGHLPRHAHRLSQVGCDIGPETLGGPLGQGLGQGLPRPEGQVTHAGRSRTLRGSLTQAELSAERRLPRQRRAKASPRGAPAMDRLGGKVGKEMALDTVVSKFLQR